MREFTLKEHWEKLSEPQKWEEYLRVVANLDDLIGNTSEAEPKGWECIHCGEETHSADYDYLVSPHEHLSCALNEQAGTKRKR